MNIASSTEMVPMPSMVCPKCGALEVEFVDGKIVCQVKAFKVDNWSWCLKCKTEWPEEKARFKTVQLPENWIKLIEQQARDYMRSLGKIP